jgi:membrane protein
MRPQQTVKQLLARIDRWQQRHAALGLPLAVLKRFGEHGGGRLAATISYWSFFSVFPLLLAFVTILNVVLRDEPDRRAELVDGALGQIPVIGTDLADQQHALGGSWVTVSLGLLAALWTGLGAARSLQVALELIADTPRYDRPNPAMQRVRALGFLVVLAVGLALSTMGANAADIIDWGPATTALGLLITFVVDTALLLVAYSVLATPPSMLRRLLPGAIFAGAALVGLQVAGSWVVTRYIAGASDTYGTFAVVIALLSWFFLLSRITLYGAELNGVLTHRLSPRALTTNSPPTEADLRAADLDIQRVQTRPGEA